jgi:fused signal recognition particle receptor
MSGGKKPGLFERLFGFGAAEPKPKPAEPTPPAKKEPPSEAPKRKPPGESPAKKEPPERERPPKTVTAKPAPRAKPPKPKGPPPAGPHPAEPDAKLKAAPLPKAAPAPSGAHAAPGEAVEPKRSWFAELRQGLSRTSNALSDNLASVLTKRKLDEETLDRLEEVLIKADLGVAMAARIRAAVAKGRYERGVTPDAVREVLAAEIASVLEPVAKPFALSRARPHVLLVVGVNGTGKTTTTAKMAHQFKRSGSSVMLAAADTFRAAAIDQLKVWGARVGAEVVAKDVGADPAGVAYEALERARAEGADVLLIDTAGRLQNKSDLMAELAKIVRVLKKLDESAPHGVVLILDATTGQNALNQVQIFQEIAGVTSLVVTKLDGTARGGILVAIAERFAIPINAIGIGEGLDDLEPFDAHDFARAIAGVRNENEAAA